MASAVMAVSNGLDTGRGFDGATGAAGRQHAVEAADHMAAQHHTSAAASPFAGLLATAVHTTAYLAVTGSIARAVYSKLGLAALRKAWFNLNLVWAAALLVTSLVTLLM
jgi:hypothetical protein